MVLVPQGDRTGAEGNTAKRCSDRAVGFHYVVCDVMVSEVSDSTNGSVTILKARSENSYDMRSSKPFAGFTQHMASGLGTLLSPADGQPSSFPEPSESRSLCAILLGSIWMVADPRDSSEMECLVMGIWSS